MTENRLETKDQRSNFVRSVEDLMVFQRAYHVSLEVHRISLTLPKIEQYALGDQIRRASKSICANLAEGFAKQRYSSAEFKRFLMMSIGSSDEMRTWLNYCVDLGYLDLSEGERLKDEYINISKMLHGLMNSWSMKS